MYQGGDVSVVKVGPKEARVTCVGSPFVRIPYDRHGFIGVQAAALRLFASKVYVREIAPAPDGDHVGHGDLVGVASLWAGASETKAGPGRMPAGRVLMTKTGRKHAVVLGASMAGLGAARALTNHFERVTVIEHDDLSDEPVARKGVPKGRTLTVSSRAAIAARRDFPGMMDELVTAGALPGDITGDFLWDHFGRWKLAG